MAKKNAGGNTSNLAAKFANKPKRKRPGVHSKKKTSKIKGSKLYKKAYRGQG
jgi:hypothetical protein